jgi:nucleoside-diphosphate-sugar epimerase
MAYIKLKTYINEGLHIMKVLVTGSEGSLMQAVIPHLIKKGHHVVGVDNLIRYGERLGHSGGGYKFIKVDLADPVLVEQIFKNEKPDVVIQAAARIYGVGGFNTFCADILGEDIALHNNVLKSSVSHGTKRVVYVSSSMVYENCPQNIDVPVTEDMPDNYPAPYTDYGLSKFTGERLSKAFAKQYGLEYTIWRPFNIITPYERSESDIGVSHVFADYIKNIVVDITRPVPIIGDGTQIRSFTWIHEVAEAIANHSFSENTKNEIFNLGNPEPISMIELAGIIHDVAVDENFLLSEHLTFKSVASYKNDVLVRIPDVSKAKTVLGWEAKQKIRESISKCLENLVL